MTAKHGTIRSRLWRDGVLEEDNFPFERISDCLEQDGSLVWVDILDPDGARLQDLAQELALDPLVVEDAFAREGRAKATRYPTYTFLTTYATMSEAEAETRSTSAEAGAREIDDQGSVAPSSGAEVDEPALATTRISAFILPRGMVTIRHSSAFDMNDVVRRWDENSDLLKFGVGALVYGLLDLIVDGHFDAIQAVDDRIEALEDSLFDERALDGEVQRRTYRIRRNLVELRRVVLPMREVVNSVLRHRRDLNAPTDLDSWFDDLYDHVLRATEQTESLRDTVTTIFETNLSLQDARLNVVMKKLTSWAAIIAVPTAVTGYFGQNVPYPGFAQEWGFVLSCVVIAGIAGALYVGFRRRGWL
ncbi:MAG: magnesium transporter CorA family protein [Nocardioidaceae bacterium]